MPDAPTPPPDPDATRARLMDLARRVGLIDASNAEMFYDLILRATQLENEVDEHGMLGLIQAYGRAIDRISSAEAHLVASRLADVPPQEFEAELTGWLERVLPLAVETFEALHRRRLEQLVRRRVDADAAHGVIDAAETVDLGVALVDLRGSTVFMLEHEPSAICDLVDDLYFAVSEVAERHAVHAGKFLGDGVIFLSRDADRLLAAARETVALLAHRTPLHAGAGVARGDVIRHAGDWFGTPVNLAARLAELAGPDEILVDAQALPPGAVTPQVRWRELLPRGLREPRRVAVL